MREREVEIGREERDNAFDIKEINGESAGGNGTSVYVIIERKRVCA